MKTRSFYVLCSAWLHVTLGCLPDSLRPEALRRLAALIALPGAAPHS